ncbi:MAG: L,D-transpeptidase family protein [Lachnospiraceae bacterium]|nr:L,D-transpeptidase family protein [Lachnospiraceae bacterium]
MKKTLIMMLCIAAMVFGASCGTAGQTAPVEDETPAMAGTETLSAASEEAADIPASLDAAETYQKIMVVTAPSAYSTMGTFVYYEYENGSWTEMLHETCVLGRDGVGQASEYTCVTPAGLYTFTHLFGNADDPGCIMPYRQLTGSEYWCGEEYYNQFVDEDVMDHSACSREEDEHLQNEESYEYTAAFNYNPENIPGEGFAFFLHCYTGENYSGGCVQIPQSAMQWLITRIDENTCIIIDTEDNIMNY